MFFDLKAEIKRWDSLKTEIKKCIDNRKANNETNQVIFYITCPKLDINLYHDETLEKVKGILEHNHVKYTYVDTVPGSWNLNRDWIETELMECAIEYSGVYPINWNLDDIIIFEELENQGQIIVLATIKTAGGEYVPNH